MGEWKVGSIEVKGILGLLGWIGDVESAVLAAGVEVFEDGEVVAPVVLVEDQVEPESGWLTLPVFGRLGLCSLLLLTLISPSCCSSFTSCAESWSCTYIMWVPIPRLMVRGERPDRKSLICRTVRRESL